MKAALLEKPQTDPIMVDDVECSDPGPGQVRIAISHCGICHSDLTFFEMDGAQVPIVMGHEAAGTVTAIGAGVTSLREGDSVMLSPFAPCDRCYHCVRGNTVLCVEAASMFTGVFPDGTSPFSRNGELVYRGLGVGGFAQETVVGETAAVKIPDEVPRKIASVMGCAVQTGVGAVINTAKVEEGATVLIMGLGGIGISVLLGTQLAAASTMIVSDPVKSRRDKAMELGATVAIDPTDVDVVEFSKDFTAGFGVDYAFDAAGSARLLETGLNAICNGGTTVMVGAPPVEDELRIPAVVAMLTTEKKLIASMYGSADSRREVPRLLDLYRHGKLDLEALITNRRPIDEINLGLDDMRKGEGIRTILEF